MIRKRRRLLLIAIAGVAIVVIAKVGQRIYLGGDTPLEDALIAYRYKTARLIRDRGMGTVSRSAAKWRMMQEDDIREAVFRWYISHSYSPGSLYFLQLGWGNDPKDPSDQFMKRFSDIRARVRKYSQSTSTPTPYSASGPSKVIEKKTGKSGVIISVADIWWIGDDKVAVEGDWFLHGRAGADSVFRVQRLRGRWTVTKETVRFVA